MLENTLLKSLYIYTLSSPKWSRYKTLYI